MRLLIYLHFSFFPCFVSSLPPTPLKLKCQPPFLHKITNTFSFHSTRSAFYLFWVNLTNQFVSIILFLKNQEFFIVCYKVYVVLKFPNWRKKITFQNLGFEDSMKGIIDSYHGKISPEMILGNALLSRWHIMVNSHRKIFTDIFPAKFERKYIKYHMPMCLLHENFKFNQM